MIAPVKLQSIPMPATSPAVPPLRISKNNHNPNSHVSRHTAGAINKGSSQCGGRFLPFEFLHKKAGIINIMKQGIKNNNIDVICFS